MTTLKSLTSNKASVYDTQSFSMGMDLEQTKSCLRVFYPHPEKNASIDDLPAEIIQLIIFSDAAEDGPTDLSVHRVSVLREVSRRWALLIESCPYLWASVRFDLSLRTMRKWVEKSKEAPLYIHATSRRSKDPLYEECMALVTENVHRWRFAELNECFSDLAKRINNPPRLLEALSIWKAEIPAHCRLFQGWSSKLRELKLASVTLPPDFEAPVGLNVLHLRTVTEVHANSQRLPMTTGKVRQALEACPNLVDLFLQGSFTLSRDRATMKPVVLKKLQKLCLFPERGQGGALLSLVEAGNCSNLMIRVKGLDENPQEWKWFTSIQGLRRAEALRIYVPGIYPTIRIVSMGGPCSVEIRYSDELRDPFNAQQAAYSITESILLEAEKDSPLTTPIQLHFGEVAFPRKDWNIPDPAWLRLLKFLQEPIVDPSSGEKRLRLPELHSILLLDSSWIKGYLKQFVIARENAFDGQTINRITEILEENWVKPPTNIFSEVMGYAGEMP